jgi:hypothetical protein
MAQKQSVDPNRYELSGKLINIDYVTSGVDAKPHFAYQDQQQTLEFSGEQIRSIETEVGTLISVTIRLTVDTGGTTFSILLPRVNIPGEQTVPVHTIGITTIHKSPIVPVTGQRDVYTVTHLTGGASRIFF